MVFWDICKNIYPKAYILYIFRNCGIYIIYISQLRDTYNIYPADAGYIQQYTPHIRIMYFLVVPYTSGVLVKRIYTVYFPINGVYIYIYALCTGLYTGSFFLSIMYCKFEILKFIFSPLIFPISRIF